MADAFGNDPNLPVERVLIMIYNYINFRSHVLGYRQKLVVLLPQGEDGKLLPGKLKCLTLLHGLSDDETAWTRWSNIEIYAEKYGIAVIMPSVEKSFYTNMVQGDRFADYAGKEILDFTRSMFPLSSKREDNMIAGLSMGGYGAFKLGLSNPDTFFAAASLSGVVDIIDLLPRLEEEKDKDILRDVRLIYGDITKVAGTVNDCYRLINDRINQNNMPRLYQWCGTEDFLYENNVGFKNEAIKKKIDLTYEEGPGDHTWPYWDAGIQRVLEWSGWQKID